MCDVTQSRTSPGCANDSILYAPADNRLPYIQGRRPHHYAAVNQTGSTIYAYTIVGNFAKLTVIYDNDLFVQMIK